MNSKVVLCIPIKLNNRQEITAALEQKYGCAYVFLGQIFRSTDSKYSCMLAIRDRKTWIEERQDIEDTDLAKAFGLSHEQISSANYQIVELSSEATSYLACREIALLATTLLEIGGVAVWVESTGILHGKERWLANYNSEDVFEIYSLYVMLLEGDERYYSCGMHNFGKADVSINLTEDTGLAIYIMNVFNYYRLTESPILQDGHTFRPDIECPRYQMTWTEDRESETDSLQYNPHGRWHLSLLTTD